MSKQEQKKYSVKRWNKPSLQAANMSCGACTEVSGVVGINMIAQDGNVFAHGHFDVRTAIAFQNQIAEAIAEARRNEAN
jgi:hypothetical protein